MSNSLWPHGLRHARLPYPSPSPGLCSNSCPLSQWCHPPISSSVIPFSSLSSIFPSIRVFSSESALHIKWPKYWSFSISPSNDHSGLISFRNHGFDILAVHGTLQHHSLKALGVISLKYIFGSPKKVLSPRNDFTSSNPWDCCILSQQPFSHWRDKPSLSPTGRHILTVAVFSPFKPVWQCWWAEGLNI